MLKNDQEMAFTEYLKSLKRSILLQNFFYIFQRLKIFFYYAERVVDPLPLMTYGLKLSLKA